MKEADAREFSESLSQIGEGWFRQVAMGIKLGVPTALGLSREEWCSQFKVSLRGDDRKKAVEELKEEGFSNRAIADVLGVDHVTVGNDLAGENSPPPRNDLEEIAVPRGENSPLHAGGQEEDTDAEKVVRLAAAEDGERNAISRAYQFREQNQSPADGGSNPETVINLAPYMHYVGNTRPGEVRFSAEVKAALEKLAKADDRSISYVINKIVAEYLRARKLIK